jgi:hypothetical protein
MTQTELLKSDFRNTLFYVWKQLTLPPPTKAQYEIASYLQTNKKRIIIECFRGIGKSWITSVFVLWTLWNDPQQKILVISASQQRSNDFSVFTHRLMKEIPIFQELQPTDDQRDSNISFDVRPALPAHAPSVKSLGLFSQITGSRANLIICDDGETPNNSLTEDAREKLMKAMSEFESILSPGGRICLLGTPQSESSVYNKFTKRGYDKLIIPARYPRIEEIGSYEGYLAPYIAEAVIENPSLVGNSTDPLRFSNIDLAERESSMGRSSFALQFMMDTTLSDTLRYPLRTSDFVVMPLSTDRGPINLSYGASKELTITDIPNVGLTGDRFFRPFFVDKEFAPYEGAVLVIDPAGMGTDQLAYVVVKQLHGWLFLLASGGFLGGYKEENLRKLAYVAKEHQVKDIVTEWNMGDGMFDQLLKPILGEIYPCSINATTDGKGIRNTIQKEKRIIDTLEPVLNRHKLIVDEKVVRDDIKQAETAPKYSLFYQLTHVTKDRGALKHDDRLDVLAMAVGYWVESMARNDKVAAEDYRKQQLQRELDDFMSYIPNWQVKINQNTWTDPLNKQIKQSRLYINI